MSAKSNDALLIDEETLIKDILIMSAKSNDALLIDEETLLGKVTSCCFLCSNKKYIVNNPLHKD
jgi:hypothetical protein